MSKSLMATVGVPVLVDEEYLKEIKNARQDLCALIFNKKCDLTMLRLAWHDAGTYDAETKTGGPNGSIRFKEEYTHAANTGLKFAIDLCEEVKAKHPRVTYADLYQLAGVVAVEVTGGPTIDFRPGRKDSNESAKEGLLPDADRCGTCCGCCPGVKCLRKVFYRMGFSDKDIVVLSGGHTLRMAHLDEKYWAKDPYKFDNSYFKELLKGDSDELRKKLRTCYGDVDKMRLLQKEYPGRLLKLPTDRALATDANFRRYVELYAKNEDAFFQDYAESHKKLSELGFTPPLSRRASF